MKNIVAAIAVIFGFNAFAGPGVEANYFVCTGENNTSVSYTSTSFVGKPSLQVAFRGQDVPLDERSEVEIQKTLVGTLATVLDNHLVPLDGPSLRYTLVVPQVILEGSHSETFSTVAIRTAVANPFFRPAPSARVVENNEIIPLACTAQSVAF